MSDTSLSGAAPPAASATPVAQAIKGGRKLTTVYVYEAPVRLWHWVNALSIVVLCITGYFIGSPFPTLSGEASAHYLMGTIRFVHFAAGYILAVGFLGRIIWAFFGNKYSRELFTFPFWRKSFWRGFFVEIKWYAFLKPRPLKFVGHNPLAQVFMFFVMVLGLAFMIVTGFALYSEGTGPGSWQDKLFGWVLPLLGGSMQVHTLHHLGMWVIILFVIIHVYSVIREDIMSRQTMVSAITNGHRTFRDDDPE
ncbi:UNVERIFIED_ORG: Ni/Fe-hydrogenase 1 B-type cytochrome subunit [Xanthobacter viscosus]|jgi:Ni/Fe-hydrogenase 1 B-type cytochrome subunit|uniref:Probable Ni/Fe-hydrogenase B-type cytochrome subunit n=1 Tax=Xanthobacter autotrophicus TaxID=280 RepID=A0A6C1KD41_XANAU|nr:Ni/Fe-hydrogenase, b-type cytochrome subunit [Xanthobacter autotrophicus]TLX42062.1 Ni/Fe-hydrogenase, b-type cytochrome subunit [Xanthobacter autotrophicus]